MRSIQVRFFAAFREMTGAEAIVLKTDASTVEELFEECRQRFPGLFRPEAALVAVNERMADWSDLLKAGDEVLFFPPVAGG